MLAYRGLTNDNIYTAHSSIAGLETGTGAWVNSGSVTAGTRNAPGLTTLEGRPYLVYNRAGNLYMRSRPSVSGSWSRERLMTPGMPSPVTKDRG